MLVAERAPDLKPVSGISPDTKPLPTASIPRIPSPTPQEKELLHRISLSRENSRLKLPPKAVRMTTITMTARAASSFDDYQTYQETIQRPKKLIRWDEATNHRPPLQIDMEGPTPWSYSPQNQKPLKETNSPQWSFGRKINTEKTRGGRTSWEKTWFQTTEPWSLKVDFNSDKTWPAPNSYKNRPLVGTRQRTFFESPSYSFGTKHEAQSKKKKVFSLPPPNVYKTEKANPFIHRTAPAYSVNVRRQGTLLWKDSDDSPGPGSYNPENTLVKRHQPAFSIRGVRRGKKHVFGPFATL